MKKTLTWITWLSLSAVSPFALAVGLGQASVGSYLNAPLNASIPLLESSDYTLDDIRVSVAEPADFAAAGLEWTPLAASVRAQIVEQQGQRQVRLSSGQTMQEPWLDLLLAVEFPGGQQFRDITLLFDPQGYSQQGQAQSAAPNAAPTPSNAATPPVAEARSAAPTVVSERGDGSSAYVGSGDTLWGVAERVKPPQASVQQMMVALLEANPDVFPSGNINDMRAGQTLSVPDAERILARSHLDADAAIKAMNEAWRARRNGSLEAVPIPDVEADTVSNLAIAVTQTLEATGATGPDSALAAGGAEPNEREASEPAVNDPTALEEAADEPEALTRAELTEQLRLSQATLQQVMEERALMRAELNALRSEVASLTQALSDALAAQEQSPEPLIASMDEMGSPGVAALVERYQWPLALAAIALLLGVLVWLRKRREETWEDVPLAEPVAKPTVTPGAAPKAASKTAPMSEAVPIAYPIQANDDDVEEPHHQSEPQVATEDEPEISYASAASEQWLIDEQAQTPEQDDTLRYENSYENSYEKSQASGLAEQGRQRRLGLHVVPDYGSDHLSLAPPLSPAPMRLLLASLSADLKSAEPAAPVDHVQPTERAPKGSEDAGHRFIDYHPPTLMNTPSSQEALRTETPMQPTVEFASQPDAETVSPAKQPRRPIEEEWEIEEVAFKPRGLDNSEPSKSSK
ncbi:FimV family protein [Halomonas sp. HAL1]|uniref:type IV pilus assembly protein FimV n=1 Tax=Halomonas sp. HAL1 TaxID=550984 RepID=UPI00022D3162|nr:FimV/HubP family polar landmark protein [Halomonas sp. HAL1]EHA17367.1 hypothetical protein HAL1_01282 [Halomonas sp. HAL1]WKV91407.1 FimV/HubP family polar landmark protein [Halomonas sp. HAL1]